jgi:hypothetical protein
VPNPLSISLTPNTYDNLEITTTAETGNTFATDTISLTYYMTAVRPPSNLANCLVYYKAFKLTLVKLELSRQTD